MGERSSITSTLKRVTVGVLSACLILAPLAVPGATSGKRPTKTKLSLVAFPGAVDEGSLALLSGHLKSSRRSCFKKVKVTLLNVSGGSSIQVASTKTNAKGAYSFTIEIDEPSTFQTSSRPTAKCKRARSRTVVVDLLVAPPPLLEGTPTAPAEDNIPDASFPAPNPDDLEFSDDAGTVMSTSEILLAPKAGATVGEFNMAITGLGGVVVGGNPEAGWVLVRLDGEHSADELLAKIDEAESDPAVDMAAPEVVLEEDRVPGTDPSPVDPPGGATTPRWTWGLPAAGGNWNLEATRTPQAWNLLDELARSQVFPGLVADIDSGFDVAHPDLAGKVTLEELGGRNANPTGAARVHGTATAGIIAARFHNYSYLDGVSPVLELEDGTNLGGVIALPAQRPTTLTAKETEACKAKPGVDQSYCTSAVFALRLLDDFVRLRKAHPEVRIYTNSMGYGAIPCAPERSVKWRAAGLSGTAVQQSAARRLVRRMGRAFERVFPDITALEGSVLWFGSAGNDSDVAGTSYPPKVADCPGRPDVNGDGLVDMDLDGDGTPDNPGPINIEARYNSPACTAALEFNVPGIFCVESTSNAPGYPRSGFSNVGGNLSAPGHLIATLAPTDAGFAKFPTSGTSFATPLAAGIANFVDIFANRGPFRDRPEQELSAQGLFQHLLLSTVASQGDRAPMIDLYYALTTLDLLNGDHHVQKALIDLDDGSLLDGNARRDNDDEDGDGKTNEPYRMGIVTDDGLRGDGKINMRDFRPFRDALLATSGLTGVVPLTDIFLDGPPDGFKEDINFDACVDKTVADFFDALPPLPPATNCSKAPAEAFFSRFDLNGDGLLNGLGTAPPPGEVAPFLMDPSTQCVGLNDPGGCIRDIDVLAEQDLWDPFFLENVLPGGGANGDCDSPTSGWQPVTDLLQDESGATTDAPDDKLDYVLSADIHLKVGADPTGDMDHVYIDVDSERPPNGIDDDGDGKVDEPFEMSFQRCLDVGPQGGKALITVPLFTGHVLVTVIGEDLDVDGNDELTPDPYGYRFPETGSGNKVRYGEDVVHKVDPST